MDNETENNQAADVPIDSSKQIENNTTTPNPKESELKIQTQIDEIPEKVAEETAAKDEVKDELKDNVLEEVEAEIGEEEKVEGNAEAEQIEEQLETAALEDADNKELVEIVPPEEEVEDQIEELEAKLSITEVKYLDKRQSQTISSTEESNTTYDEVERLLNEYSDDTGTKTDETSKHGHLEEPEEVDSIQAKFNFLQFKIEIPSLSEISEEHIIEHRKTRDLTPSDRLLDTGEFVDPLTGRAIRSFTSSSIGSSSTPSTVGEEVIPDIESASLHNLSDFQIPVASLEDDDDDAFVKFKNSLLHVVESVVDDTHAKEVEALKKENLQIALDFLFELFDNVVKKSEKANNSLHLILDKRKMLDVLKEVTDKYYLEKQLNIFLGSRMCDYYKRMKNFRSFKELPPEKKQLEYNKYKEALSYYDHLLKVAAETKKKNALLMSSVMMDMTHVSNIVMDTEEHLENVMLKTIGSKSEYLKRLTDLELRHMNQKRNEISDTRLSFITRKHTLGHIADKIYKLERINDKLHMDDFITKQNQVAALAKKIEERTEALEKMRENYQANLHLIQHNREKAFTLAHKLKEYEKNLREKRNTQRKLRESLYEAKLERGRLRKRHADLTYQGGLLSLPTLMYDYDATVERVQDKQNIVKELRETLHRVSLRIVELEARCI